jgi:glycosyltransferase involved in cell wall biosynthesis
VGPAAGKETFTGNDGHPRIGINAHLLSGEAGYRRAGIHHYIDQVARHLPADGTHYVLFTRRAGGWDDRPDFEIVTSSLPTDRRLARIAWEQTVWTVEARRRRLDLLHSMAFVAPPRPPCPFVVTVYDLSFIHLPESFPARQRRYLAAQTARACRLAERVVTISESGKADVEAIYGVPAGRIDVVVPGVSNAYRRPSAAELDAFRAREEMAGRFLLHVGTLQPRKNIPVLLRALARLHDRDVRLALVGGKGWLYDEIFAQVEALGLRERVRFIGYVDDADLPLWYGACAALVFPSLYEGFGLPVVEAMACGAPVIAARTSSLPEAGGDAALYFDPHDDGMLAGQIDRLLGDPALAADLQRRGAARAARFSWSGAGAAMALSYRRALGLSRPVEAAQAQ